MLPQNLPPAAVYAIGWLFVLLFVSGIAGAVCITFPETVRSRFELVPDSGADPVQAPYPGVAVEICVSEMDEVKKGEKLFVVQSDEFRRRDVELHTLIEDLRARREKISRLEQTHQAELDILDEQIVQVEGEKTFLAKLISTNRKLRDTLARLHNKGAASQLQLDQQELALIESEKDLISTGVALNQTRLTKHKAIVERVKNVEDESAEIVKLEYRIEALQQDLTSAKGNLLEIRAPYDAVIVNLSIRNPGGVIEAGDPLCTLAPVDAKAEARLLIEGEGVSRIAIGQKTRLFFDAFPYQRYGTVPARIDSISPAALPVNGEEPRFPAVAILDSNRINAHGKSNPLRLGMTGEARTVVGRRSLLEYALEPIRRVREDYQAE